MTFCLESILIKPENKAKMKEYQRKRQKEYNQTPEYKAKKKAYYLRKKAEKLTISTTCL